MAKARHLIDKLPITNLNHIGISYVANDFKKELQDFASFPLYHEPSSEKDSEWYFVGSTTANQPMFEVVLNRFDVPRWTPHFQIDVDTSLTANQLQKIGCDWQLNVPKVGVVLGMKILGQLEGTKICLGIGTELRNREIHRHSVLQRVRTGSKNKKFI